MRLDLRKEACPHSVPIRLLNVCAMAHPLSNLRGKLTRFAVVGIVGVGMNYAIFLLAFAVFGIDYMIAGACGFVLPLPVVFLLNRTWTFQSSVSFRSGMPVYFATTLFSLGCHSATQWFAGEILRVPEIFSQLFGIAVSAVVSFILAHTVVFTARCEQVRTSSSS